MHCLGEAFASVNVSHLTSLPSQNRIKRGVTGFIQKEE
jgi:hypothetical protein